MRAAHEAKMKPFVAKMAKIASAAVRTELLVPAMRVVIPLLNHAFGSPVRAHRQSMDKVALTRPGSWLGCTHAPRARRPRKWWVGQGAEAPHPAQPTI
ncbi:hypothetical protein SCMU_41440 [Sinomonas cyclohexanicum]|uniref:Uncharacterized protein n=1 Tax=Sinomonas cyclohexanicum TaxID=322009 RepID=A0ABM7Q155_SINCY|nr:hypothetical protein SCMU_41440 [Corynebacterium cyclohexanicum]